MPSTNSYRAFWRIPLKPTFGLGAWWAWLYWTFLPLPTQFSHSFVGPAGDARLIVTIGLTLAGPVVAFFGPRLLPLRRRCWLLVSVTGVASLSCILVSLAHSGVVGAYWHIVGQFGVGFSATLLAAFWIEFMGTRKTGVDALDAAGSPLAGAVLCSAAVLVASVSRGWAEAIIAILPWLSFALLLSGSRTTTVSPAQDRVLPQRVFRLPVKLFGSMLILGLANGLMVSFTATGSASPSPLVLAEIGYAVAGLGMLVAALRTRGFDPGLAYRVVAPLTILGYLFLTLAGSGQSIIAGAFVATAYGLWWTMITISFAKIYERSSSTALIVAGLSYSAGAGGHILGIVIYYLALGSGHAGSMTVASISLGVAFLLSLAAAISISDRNISTLWGIEGAPKPGLTRIPLEERCAEIAAAFSLTPKESEILCLLARGRNREYIQKTLHISSETVKTHVKHVYVKLGVHSHQDLIDLVEHDGCIG